MRGKYLSLFCLIMTMAWTTCAINTYPGKKEKPAPDGPGQEVEQGELKLAFSQPPVPVNGDYQFAANVAYDRYTQTVFDIFLPKSDQPTPLLIYIHGGGFTSGDKRAVYEGESGLSGTKAIEQMVQRKVAYATVNYRLLDGGDRDGVLKSLDDSKRCLQFIRYHAKELNIDPNRVVLMGSSAGGGTALWLGVMDDMADRSSADPVERQSTRVDGVVTLKAQSTYDILKWETVVFKSLDLNFERMIAGSPKWDKRLGAFYGINSWADMTDPKVVRYREKVDMLGHMDRSDPEVYVYNNHKAGGNKNGEMTFGVLLHHPQHAVAIMERAKEVGMQGQYDIPAMNINTTGGESITQFILRKLK